MDNDNYYQNEQNENENRTTPNEPEPQQNQDQQWSAGAQQNQETQWSAGAQQSQDQQWSAGAQQSQETQWNGEQFSQDRYSGSYIMPEQPKKKKNGLGIAALILGIISLISCCCFWLSIILGVVSIILGIISLAQKEDTKGFAIAGIVLGAMGVVITVATVITSSYMYKSGMIDQFKSNYYNEFGIDHHDDDIDHHDDDIDHHYDYDIDSFNDIF